MSSDDLVDAILYLILIVCAGLMFGAILVQYLDTKTVLIIALSIALIGCAISKSE